MSSVNILYVVCSTGQGAHAKCSQAFLFSMVNPHGLGPTKLPLKTGSELQFGIYCNNGYGPTFGGGHDLRISVNTNTNSQCLLGNTYKHPPGQQNTFFTGGMNFTVTDYEVFGLHE